MPPRKKPDPKPELVEVAPVGPMLIQHFRQHVEKRHPQMRFRTKEEHAADHRLHADVMNHIHTDQIPEEEETADAEV